MIKHRFIKEIATEQTGGGCMVDFITLINGQVIAIDNDLIGLYSSMDEFWDGKDGSWDHVKLLEWGTCDD
jgi:hypothetical protein